jgi:hypothetical protein
VTSEFLNRPRWRSSHCQMRAKRVTEDVESPNTPEVTRNDQTPAANADYQQSRLLDHRSPDLVSLAMVQARRDSPAAPREGTIPSGLATESQPFTDV